MSALLQIPDRQRQHLLASGPEFLLIAGIELITAPIIPIGILVSMMLTVWFTCRDLGGGRFHPGRRLAQLKLVDEATGREASSQQAILRNLPYIVGFAGSIFTGTEVFFWAMMVAWTAAELLTMRLDPSARRLGDQLAGTRLVSGNPALSDEP